MRRVQTVRIVAGQAATQAVQPLVVTAEQRIEGRTIAVLRGGDEGYVVVNRLNLLGGHLQLGDLRVDPT